MFTPVDGGQYQGDGFSVQAPSGSVLNGEFIGVSMQPGESASNVGQTHQRYTLAGDWYSVTAVDSGSVPVTDYQLNASVQVCIPLPHQLKTKIDDVAVVAMNSGTASFTVLSSRVVLKPDGSTQLCGNQGSLPAKIAAAKQGAPQALLVGTPEPDPITPPETGGFALPIWLLLMVSAVGLATAISGTVYLLAAVNLLGGHLPGRRS